MKALQGNWAVLKGTCDLNIGVFPILSVLFLHRVYFYAILSTGYC